MRTLGALRTAALAIGLTLSMASASQALVADFEVFDAHETDEVGMDIMLDGEAAKISTEDHVSGQISYTKMIIEFTDGPTDITGVELSGSNGLVLVLADGEWIKVEDGQMDELQAVSSLTMFKVDLTPTISNPIPEPGAALLFGIGLLSVSRGWSRRARD